MKEQEIKSTVYSMFKENRIVKSQDQETEVIDVVRLQDGVPYVTISTDRKYTQGLPKYCSASASVFVSVPCIMNEEEMEKAYAFASAFCERKLAEKIKQMTGE